MAPQSSAMNGLRRRSLCRWIACATSSLPVPVSPRISTVKFDAATVATCSTTCSNLRARPHLQRPDRFALADAAGAGPRPPVCSAAVSSARRTTSTMLVVIDRLGQVVEGAELGGANRRLHVACAVSITTGSAGAGLQLLEHLEPIELGQAEIEQHHVGTIGSGALEAGAAVVRASARRSPRASKIALTRRQLGSSSSMTRSVGPGAFTMVSVPDIWRGHHR